MSLPKVVAQDMLQKLMSPQALIDLSNESFPADVGQSTPAAGEWAFEEVAASTSKRIQMPMFASGLFSQDKVLPMRVLNNLVIDPHISSVMPCMAFLSGGTSVSKCNSLY